MVPVILTVKENRDLTVRFIHLIMKMTKNWEIVPQNGEKQNSHLDKLEFGDYAHSDACVEVHSKLGAIIEDLKCYMFSGAVTDKEQADMLLKALSTGTFMHEFLSSYRTNLLIIATSFIDDYAEWKAEREASTK